MKDRTRMVPECGAGMLFTLMTGAGAVEYALRWIWRASVYTRNVGLRAGMMCVYMYVIFLKGIRGTGPKFCRGVEVRKPASVTCCVSQSDAGGYLR